MTSRSPLQEEAWQTWASSLQALRDIQGELQARDAEEEVSYPEYSREALETLLKDFTRSFQEVDRILPPHLRDTFRAQF